MTTFIRLSDIRVNNLDIPRLELALGKLHVFSGPSGSGKSSLAFDVLYAEADARGQARGVSRVYRKAENRYKVEGMPGFTIGIEQQLTSGGLVESVAWHIGLPRESNRPLCPLCGGKGYLRDIDPERVVRDPAKKVTAGALTPAVKACVGLDTPHWKRYCDQAHVNSQTPWRELPPETLRLLLSEGTPYFKPILPTLRGVLSQSPSGELAEELPYYVSYPRCPQCHGWGVLDNTPINHEEPTLGGVQNRGAWFRRWVALLGLQAIPLRAPLFRLSSATARKLRFLAALWRLPAHSLVIFDEPAAGMTHAEALQMAGVLREVQKEGHTVIAVEHMWEVVCAADVVTHFGPGSGSEGGRIQYQGAPRAKDAHRYSRPKRPSRAIEDSSKRLQARFASWFGFSGFEVNIPQLLFTCVCGPSGSGKTAYLEACHAACDKTPVAWQGRVALESRKGNDAIRRPHKVTPDPIGLHAGSTPATYTRLWDKVRDVFAALPEAKKRRLAKGHFSFNSPKGQCPRCKGRGFLTGDDTHYEECPLCHGARFVPKVLAVQYQGVSIAEVNAMTIRQAARLFSHEKNIKEHLAQFMEVALEYLVLGQPSNTLSGGENLRVKIVDLLSRKLGDRSLYLMDNPCRGVGFDATSRLINTFQALTQKHTVLVAENDPAVASRADWLIILDHPKKRSDGTVELNVRYAGPPAGCPATIWEKLAPGT